MVNTPLAYLASQYLDLSDTLLTFTKDMALLLGKLTLAKSQTNKSSNRSTTRLHIQSLPKELQLEIFDHLGPVPSTCLGLTCKEFYEIHRKKHGVVSLKHSTLCSTSSGLKGVTLGQLLTKAPGRPFRGRPYHSSIYDYDVNTKDGTFGQGGYGWAGPDLVWTSLNSEEFVSPEYAERLHRNYIFAICIYC